MRFLMFVGFVLMFLEGTTQQYKDNYGNTPNELLPYGRFQQPYKLFFKDEQLYLGPGRSKKAPPDLDSVKIGFLGPLTNSEDSAYGRSMLHGARLALDEANEKGGYLGIPFELLAHNDAGLWGASGNEMVKLNDQKVWAVLGSIDGQNTHIALRVALKVELPIVTTGCTDPTLTETRIPWIIRINDDDRQNNYALALHMFEERGFKKVAVLRANNRYGRMGVVEFIASAQRLGHPVQLHLRFAPGVTDFTYQLTKINEDSAQAVLIWGSLEETAGIINQMKRMHMKQPVFASDRIVSDRFLALTGKNAEGVTAVYPFNPEDNNPQWQNFKQKYILKYQVEPDQFAALAYDGMQILTGSIRKAGLNRAKIRDELTSITNYHGVTGEIILDASWNDIGPVSLTQVKNGKFVFRNSPLQ